MYIYLSSLLVYPNASMYEGTPARACVAYDCVRKSPMTEAKGRTYPTQCCTLPISFSFWSYNPGLRLRHLHLTLTPTWLLIDDRWCDRVPHWPYALDVYIGAKVAVCTPGILEYSLFYAHTHLSTRKIQQKIRPFNHITPGIHNQLYEETRHSTYWYKR